MASPTHARLHTPPAALSGCVHLAVERDTRGLALPSEARFNHFPASPLPTLSWIFAGRLCQVLPEADGSGATGFAALDRFMVSGPQSAPVTSWSDGDVHALTVAFYPEAMRALFGVDAGLLKDRTLPAKAVLNADWLDPLSKVESFEQLCFALQPHWIQLRADRRTPLIGDWALRMASRAAQSRTGRGLRQIQRRIKDWTGMSQREIALMARVETAFVIASQMPNSNQHLARIAIDAGYSDQSHMGRSVRRVTGFSPAVFQDRLRNDPTLWMYRLLQEHHLA